MASSPACTRRVLRTSPCSRRSRDGSGSFGHTTRRCGSSIGGTSLVTLTSSRHDARTGRAAPPNGKGDEGRAIFASRAARWQHANLLPVYALSLASARTGPYLVASGIGRTRLESRPPCARHSTRITHGLSIRARRRCRYRVRSTGIVARQGVTAEATGDERRTRTAGRVHASRLNQGIENRRRRAGYDRVRHCHRGSRCVDEEGSTGRREMRVTPDASTWR